MNFNRPSAENPEYKEISKEDVIDYAAQELVNQVLMGSGQDFIVRRRPQLVAETREKVEQIYEGSKDMFENFPGDTNRDSKSDRIERRAGVLMSLFNKSENIDLVGERNPAEDIGFSEAISTDGFAVAYVMGVEGTNEVDKIENFINKVKNTKRLVELFKNQDAFGHSKFQEALIASDLDAALGEFRNFQERQLGGGKEEIAG